MAIPAALALCDSPTAAAASGETGTDAATKNSQTCIDSALAATAEALAAREHRRSWWLEKCPLDEQPSEEWANAITVSAERPRPWLPVFISSYRTLRHLIQDSVDRQGLWTTKSFETWGVTSA